MTGHSGTHFNAALLDGETAYVMRQLGVALPRERAMAEANYQRRVRAEQAQRDRDAWWDQFIVT